MRYTLKRNRVIVFLFILGTAMPGESKAQSKNGAIESKINAMLKQMTLEEKAGQMAQVSIESLGSIQNGNFVFNQDKFKDAVVNYKIGSILNTPGLQNPQQWNTIIGEIQNAAKETPMKIPVLYGLDDNHG